MERYQVLLDPSQRQRLERIAKKQQRSLASVLRQALALGLDRLEGSDELWRQRMTILEAARKRIRAMPLIEEDLVNEAREEREGELKRVWHAEL